MATAAAILAATASVTACSGSDDPVDLDVTDARQDTQEPDEGDDGDPGAGDLGELEVTVDGDAHRFTPTEVRCSGSPEELHHLIATTDEQAPRAEVAGDHFAAVALADDERPYETSSPQGIKLGEEQVTFEAAEIGDAVVDGTLHCTAWED